jgi:hypothetical protein
VILPIGIALLAFGRTAAAQNTLINEMRINEVRSVTNAGRWDV